MAFRWIARTLRRAAPISRLQAALGWAGVARLALITLVLRRKDWIAHQIVGERVLDGAKRVAIFAHYDPCGRVHDYVVYYLEALRAAGYEIVFVSNAPKLDDRAVNVLRPLCAIILRRVNVGYDFGAYKDALSVIGELSAFEELIVANDSVYGPLHDLATILKRCDASASVWGITDSWSQRYHLQSYFLLFRKDALAAPCMRKFWDSVRYGGSKTWVISKCEVRLTQFMLREGLRCAALYPYRSAVAALTTEVFEEDLLERKDLSDPHRRYLTSIFGAVQDGTPLNVMHHFWDHLIIRMHCPFIKRELLQSNPARVPFVYRWEDAIRRVSTYDTDLIVRHLQSGLRDRSI
jgi:lipopolysaccharide biosynthesis protein